MAERQAREERDRSLEWLEGDNWGEPGFGSYVVTTSHALRRKPLKQLTAEELRLALGQPPFEQSLPYLVPLALEMLEPDPLLCATFYDGDLLRNLLRIPKTYWVQHPEQKKTAGLYADRAQQAVDERRRTEDEFGVCHEETLFTDVVEAIVNFRLP
jgi:hypothetical protein